jgi:elongation factor G
MGGNIPTNFIPAVEKVRNSVISVGTTLRFDGGIEQGFFEALERGSLSGNQITGCRFVLKDGAFHVVDSSELAFRNATIGAFREAYQKSRPVILEPIMTVEVVAPVEFQSTFSPHVFHGPIFTADSRRCHWWAEHTARDDYRQ